MLTRAIHLAALTTALVACTSPKSPQPPIATEPGEYYIMGSVAHSGVLTLNGPITIIDALRAAGVTQDKNSPNVDRLLLTLYRTDGVVPFNHAPIKNFYIGTSENFAIQPNDLLWIHLPGDAITHCYSTPIYPGDQLTISIRHLLTNDTDTAKTQPVPDSGNITFTGLKQPLNVDGLEASQLRATLLFYLKKQFPHLTPDDITVEFSKPPATPKLIDALHAAATIPS